LNISPDQDVVFERYSDSAASFVVLNESDPQVFKTLIRAAKAKLKLRLRVSAANASAPTLANEQNGQQDISGHVSQENGSEQRNIGSGIFSFRDSQASQHPLINLDESAHVHVPSIAPLGIMDTYTPAPGAPLAIRTKETVPSVAPWSVYCNECDAAMSDEHFHCGICDDGDYDLCERCVSNGKVCPGKDHWLVKRFIKDGKVVASTTERVRKTVPTPVAAPPAAVNTAKAAMFMMNRACPGPSITSFVDADRSEPPSSVSRTCNGCVVVLPDREFVHCDTCEDFDLCLDCHYKNKHGHHPAHGFVPATKDTYVSPALTAALAPGRDIRHNAVCDGCDKQIRGIRHKCLKCPDWDYCSDCIKYAENRHAGHRFVRIYEPIADSKANLCRHSGVMCDGPLCSNKPSGSFIVGVRYKCTICHDTDFCASCEAHPSNNHNGTHPLLKLKTPVGNVNISTENEIPGGQIRIMGDRRPMSIAAITNQVNEAPIRQTNTATAVQTVAEIKPIEIRKEEVSPPAAVTTLPLDAHFVSDAIADGTLMQSDALFTQVWTMKNTGHLAWPAGCSVCCVGGDNMLNVDNKHPALTSDIPQASETNIIGRPVNVGEHVAFKVTLKAPTREGRAISYWRVKTADGNAFGQRLWCDVMVKKTAPQVSSVVHPVDDSASKSPVSGTGFPHWANVMRAKTLAREQAQAQLRAQQEAALAHQAQLREQMQAQHAQMSSQHQSAQAHRQQMMEAQVARVQQFQAQVRAQAVADEQAQKQRDAYMQAHRKAQENQMPVETHESAYGKLQDYQMQLMLLEQQNKRRLLIARREQEKVSPSPVAATARESIHPRFSSPEWDPASIDPAKAPAAQDVPVMQNTDDQEKLHRILSEHAKNATADDDVNGEAAMERSSMVFPKLDRESPASSAYQSAIMTSRGKAAYVENEDGQVENVAVPAAAAAATAVSATSDVDHAKLEDDDIEVLSATGEDSDDDTFDTDDEYDILDASDEETVA
jgi:next-to-BRCA1 protein 1